MDTHKYAGILIILLGLIFMIFPVFSSAFVSVLVGLSLLFLGISTIILGLNVRFVSGLLYILTLLIGILSIIFGILFLFYIDAVSFLVSLQFYIIGFMMIYFGICGLIFKEGARGKIMAIIIMILGIVSIYLGAFAAAEPMYIAIIIGIVLVMEGILVILDD